MADSHQLHVPGVANDIPDLVHEVAGAQPVLTLAARQSDYERVTEQWLSISVERIMRERDQLYAEVVHQHTYSAPTVAVQLPDGEEWVIEPTLIRSTGSVDGRAAINGDFDDLHTVLSTIADERLEQIMKGYFAQAAEGARRVGNEVVVDMETDTGESILALLDRMEFQFDDSGRAPVRLIVSPHDEESVRRQIDALTPDQVHRLEQLITRKREAYFASRRRRRLPRHGL